MYQVARELGKTHRSMLQLLRELGYQVPSHMATLQEDEERNLREAVDRQERGAPAVRPVHATTASVDATQVAEVIGTIDIEEQDVPGAGTTAAEKARKAGLKDKKRKPKDTPARRILDKEELEDEYSLEAQREGLEMVVDGEAEVLGPPAPAEGTPQPSGVIRTVDLSAVEEAPPTPQTRRRAVVNVGGRQMRTLQRRKQRGPKVSIQASQTLAVPVPISMKEFSQIVGVKANDMLKALMQETKEFFTINHVLDRDTVEFLADQFDRAVVIAEQKTAEELMEQHAIERDVSDDGEGELRPPVVTILGHVDHGKTSLLDRIRSSNVVASEHGGITQHIGAFQVETEGGRRVTFLDTPGHAAFTAMRARGAKVADIVVLVVAADDGIMPQTVEAITHAQLAKAPIVVAINKVDKANANVTKVKQQLAAHGLTPEDWGGETITCEVSALKGDGIEQLLEMLALQAEMAELRANPTVPARGRVIEGRKDPHRGVICTLLVQEGTLRRGDAIVAGMGMGRVRTMLDDQGRTVKEAPPGTPVEVFGLDDVPDAGDEFVVTADERLARQAVDERKRLFRDATVQDRVMPSLEALFSGSAADVPKELRIILKADVRGSLEPLQSEIQKLQHAEVKLNLLYAQLGAVTKSDVDNAIATGAVIIGFHVLTEPAAKREAERAGVEIRHYMVIYEVIDDLRAAMEQTLAPERRQEITGHAEVRAVFASSKFGNIAGCFVIDGVIRRADYVRIYREGRLIYGGDREVQIDSLRRIKEDVREVREGFECGIRISAYQDIKEHDVIEFYELKEVRRTLETQARAGK